VLAASVVSGLLLSTRLAGRRLSTATMRSSHRWLGIAGLSLVGVHLMALVADSYVHFGTAEVAIPFASDWRRVPVAFGVVAMWTLVAVGASTAIRPQLRPATWRSVHLLSYASYAAATIHLLTAGTDRASGWVLASVALVTTTVAVLSLAALLQHQNRTEARARRMATAPAPATAPPAAAATAPGFAVGRRP
jgi:DMSO/TMAO reductase YedYZ heme-binding membrane subunit